jgi:hypothetical protein
MFDAFKKELTAHSDGCYHRLFGVPERSEVISWFRVHGITPPSTYLDFICEIGAGSFFGGSLVIYPLSGHRSVQTELVRLKEATGDSIFPFGYDGTTESCYCLQSHTGSEAVCWFSWEEKIKRSLSPTFQEWIEGKPSELFSADIYAGYKNLTNVDELVAVMEERSAFRVRLLNFDKQLQRPPDKPNDMLRRYNKVVLEITKTRPVTIEVLTVMITRLGSRVGGANIEFTTFPVQGIPVNVATVRECFVFDPFNVPFDTIVVNFNPVIDLGSKTRVRYRELSKLLV